MKRCLIMLCVSVVLTGGIIGSAHAYPASVGLFFDGIDLDTGTVEYDRTILVIQMGDTIEDIEAIYGSSQANAKSTTNFSEV